MLSASDLADGSQTVMVDGNPTALEDSSYVSTSTGDEAGTQGGSVITHKTKGKGYFNLWSFTLLIEGKGADRHGDPMGQNCASGPPSCVDMQALVDLAKTPGFEIAPCPPYDRKALGLEKPTTAQYKKVRGKPCWECAEALKTTSVLRFTTKRGIVRKTSAYTSGRRDTKKMTPDHQPPIAVAWDLGGCHLQPSPDAFIEWANHPDTVRPHCKYHSGSQSGTINGRDARAAIEEHLVSKL
jgi:hypothetical protein